MIELVCDICGKREPAKHYGFHRMHHKEVDLCPEGWHRAGREDRRLPPGLLACSVPCARALREKHDPLVLVNTPEDSVMLMVLPHPDEVKDMDLHPGICVLRSGDRLYEWSLRTGLSMDEDGYDIAKSELPRLRKLFGRKSK